MRDLIRLCKSNKRFSRLCRDPATWRFLLTRDYGIETMSNDAMKIYIGAILKVIAKKSNEFANKIA